MNLHPTLSALRRHKAGVFLIAMQIALTLAIVCNAVFIIGERMVRIDRPTGLNEDNLFLITQQWVGAPSMDTEAGVAELDSMLKADLAALRDLPDVASASFVGSLPLLNSSWNGQVSTKPGENDPGDINAQTTQYYFGKDVAETLGYRVIAGRDFLLGEYRNHGFRDQFTPAVVMITQAIADKLYPEGAVGKTIYMSGGSEPSTIVGVVERLQVPSTQSWASSFVWNATLIPARLNGFFSRYAVRAKPGRMDEAMAAARDALYAVTPMRVVDDEFGVKSFAEIRADAYKGDVGMAILMGMICLILVLVTAAGIVGLTSFWVGQRRKQIGVRRALGARKLDILRYFQLENLIIAGGGALLGIALAVGLNLLLMQQFEMDRLPIPYVLAGVVLVLLLGQAAAIIPARRAAEVPPVVATRSV